MIIPFCVSIYGQKDNQTGVIDCSVARSDEICDHDTVVALLTAGVRIAKGNPKVNIPEILLNLQHEK